MAGASVRIEFSGLEALKNRLLQLERFSVEPLLESMGEEAVSQTVDRFEEERSPEGESWKPSRRVQLHGGQTLTDTGRLKRSINYQVEGSSARVGSDAEYAAIHQFGGRAGRGHSVEIPARPFLGFGERDVDELQKIVDDFVSGALQ